jgi:hypothetical protein
MKNASIVLILISISFISVIHVYGQPIAKEGEVSGVFLHSGAIKIIELAEGTGIINWENKGVWKEDSSEGPFHNSLISCAGVFIFLKGVGKSHGNCVLADSDGDKYLFEVTQENMKLEPGRQEGKFIIIGGTGKFSGIQGEGVFKRHDVRSIREAIYQEGLTRVKGRYKLP